jgi:hypothetical protein
MESNDKPKVNKGGRKPKMDPAVHRYSISLNEIENEQFITMFEQSGMKVMAHFITACLFQKPVKTVKINMDAVEFHTQLTKFFSLFRSVGVNYNQVVKILYRNFTEKKAAAYLFRLEKQTIEMAILCKNIMELTQVFESKYLLKIPDDDC